MTLELISTSASTYDYEVAAGKFLLGIEVKSTSAQTLSIGTTPAGSELAGPQALDANQPFVQQEINLSSFNSNTLYFSGLAGANTIKIWLLG